MCWYFVMQITSLAQLAPLPAGTKSAILLDLSCKTTICAPRAPRFRCVKNRKRSLKPDPDDAAFMSGDLINQLMCIKSLSLSVFLPLFLSSAGSIPINSNSSYKSYTIIRLSLPEQRASELSQLH